MAEALSTDRDYFLGTHDEELARLGLQHRVWQPTVLECWRRAGIKTGSRVLDVGAGPGYAAADLAALVGPDGSVTAAERSARFINAGQKLCAARGISNVSFHEVDLMADPLPGSGFDASWCRWVACFVSSPALLVDKIAAALRPGGIAVFHEYVHYASLRLLPSGPCMDDFVQQVMKDWRASGGEPDIAPLLVALLQERGFTVRDTLPRIFCARPGEETWQWPASFVDINLKHQLARDPSRAQWAEAVRNEFLAAEKNPTTMMLTPMVLEIVAEKT